MWGRKRKPSAPEQRGPGDRSRLKEAVHEARIEAAERTGVVVDLRDAELARIEFLNEALDPLFADIPAKVELFDRGISRGDTPRLWIDAVAHVEMGRDKREYRFVQDTRYGRKVLAQSYNIPDLVEAITRYVARRLVERERALAEGLARAGDDEGDVRLLRRRQRWRSVRIFLYGLIAGVIAVFIAAALSLPH